MNKVGDYLEEETTLWQKVGMVLASAALIGLFWGFTMIGYTYYEHKLCMNGAVEHCIPEDFQ